MTDKIKVLSEAEREHVFGHFNYTELGGGRIQISARWVEENIVGCRLAKADGQGGDVVTRCHRLAKAPLEHAFAELAGRDLWKLISAWSGLWVARHMTWNPLRSLSSHSWGIAFDLNAARNPYGGGVSSENRALNEVFNRYGFAWGGDWNGAKDAMHWELADVGAWQHQKAAVPRLILAVERGTAHSSADPDFSYHAIASATLDNGDFSVDAAQVAPLLGARAGQPGQQGAGQGVKPLRDVLQGLGAQIVRGGDHLQDADDPRYYVFVKPAA